MSTGPRFAELAEWLDWQQRLHPAAIELGLERVGRVLARTGWRAPTQPVITVGGTNGKGSCVALLTSLLRAGGYRVGAFTSPHLIDYRERIRLDGTMVSAASLLVAFERIADALGDDSLTYFEFNALAALLVFETFAPDAIVLEVGMGGRLDAVNLVDADVAVVTSIGIDHAEYLGATEELIGFEKAGIFRAGRPGICGMEQPPRSLVAHARDIGSRLLLRGRDFDARTHDDGTWSFSGTAVAPVENLPMPALSGPIQVTNAATALMALETLRDRLPLQRAAIVSGLQAAHVAGRFQRIDDARGFEWVLDVGHNPAAAAVLADSLATLPVPGRTLAVCGMLGDKDVGGVLAVLAGSVDRWFGATTDGARALTDRELVRRAADAGIAMTPGGSVASAMAAAAAIARPGDRILVFGSFHTVGPALAALGVPL
jgi:dihydrofolate synthase / folylpolyglutamate synthase